MKTAEKLKNEIIDEIKSDFLDGETSHPKTSTPLAEALAEGHNTYEELLEVLADCDRLRYDLTNDDLVAPFSPNQLQYREALREAVKIKIWWELEEKNVFDEWEECPLSHSGRH